MERQVGDVLIRQGGLADRVAQHLMEKVLDGTLERNVQLPAERVLAEQYGVSRTVIREALRSLVSKGILEIRSGSGTYVRGPDAAAASESISLLLRMRHGTGQVAYEKALEIRNVLEVEIAGLAAERATAADLAVLGRELDHLRGAAHDRKAFIRADVSFHAALAAATGNELFEVVLNSIADVMREVRRVGFDTEEGFSSAVYHHQRIYDAISRRDTAAARLVMAAHLEDSSRIVREGLQLEAAREQHHS